MQHGASTAFGALSVASAGVALASKSARFVVPLTRGFAATAATTAGVTALALGTHVTSKLGFGGHHINRDGQSSFLASLFASTTRCLERVLIDESNDHKQYVVDVKSFSSTFGLSAVLIRAVLNLGVSFSRVVTDWLEEAAAIEEEARNHPSGEPQRPLPKFEWEQPFWASVGLFIRETVVVLTRRGVEKLVVFLSTMSSSRRIVSSYLMTPKFAAKLLKDVPRSARRKCERLAWEKGLSRTAKATGMARTAANASITRITAELIIASSISAVACRKLYQLRKSGALPAPEMEREAAEREGEALTESTDATVKTLGKRLYKTLGTRFAIEVEVGSLYFRLLFGHCVKGACLLIGGACGAAAVAALRKDDCPKWALRLTFLGMAAGEAVGVQVASTALATVFGGRR